MHEWRNPFELRLPGSLIAAAGEMVKSKRAFRPVAPWIFRPRPAGSMTSGHDKGTARMNLTYCLIDLLGATWWGLIVFSDSQNPPYTHPCRLQAHRSWPRLMSVARLTRPRENGTILPAAEAVAPGVSQRAPAFTEADRA
jgi:hypothetical protein